MDMIPQARKQYEERVSREHCIIPVISKCQESDVPPGQENGQDVPDLNVTPSDEVIASTVAILHEKRKTIRDFTE